MNPRGESWLTFEREGIRFDNSDDGLASVSAVRQVDHFGFVVMMRPSIFLALTHALKPIERPDKLIEFIGGGGAIATPFLSINPDAETIRIRQHEGRHRMHAISRLAGDVEIPVAFLLDFGYRASDVDEDLIDRLRNGMFSEARGNPSVYVDGPLFGSAWLRGEELSAPTLRQTLRR